MCKKKVFKELLPLLTITEGIMRDLGEADTMLMGELYDTHRNVYLEIGKSQE